MDQLIHLLDADASRPAPIWQVWHATSLQVDSILEGFLIEALRDPFSWYLAAGGVDIDELGSGSWIGVGEEQWRVPIDLRSDDFLGSQLHLQGNYAIYKRSAGVLPDRLPLDLPWWGTASWRRVRVRWSAEALVMGLRKAAVDAAVAVHPDATELVAVVP